MRHLRPQYSHVTTEKESFRSNSSFRWKIGCAAWLAFIGLAGTAAAQSPVRDTTISADTTTGAKTVATPAFSTTASNELLLAFVSGDDLGGTNTTVTGVAGAGLTWTLVVRTNKQSGTAEIWRAFSPAALSNVSVTATLSQSVDASITVMTFSGVDATGTNGSGAIGATGSNSASKGAPTASLVTTRNNSWVFGVGTDFDNAIARTVPSGQSLVHQDLSPTGDTYWVQMLNAPTPVSGTSVTLNDTAPTGDRFDLSLVEVLPPASVSPTWTLSGSITPSTSGSGATVALSGAATGTTTADSNGNYSFTGLANGTYTVTPSKSGFTFTPPNQQVTINGANQAAVNFTVQAVPTWTISGTISPATLGSGTSVALSGASTGATTADANGNYSFTGLANGLYTVTPSKSGLTFNPPNQQVTVSGANQTSINFTAQPPPTWTISGTISPTAAGSGATVTLSGASSGSTTADANGNYSFAGLANGSYTVTPAKPGYIFAPPNQPVTVNGVNQNNVNFTGSVPTSITIDADVSQDGAAKGTTITSPAFSTASGEELLLAFISTDYLSGANTTVTAVTGGGLTWTLVVRANAQSGGSEIWRAFAGSPLSGTTVTATLSQSVVSSITVLSFIGANPSGTNGAGAIGATASKSAATGAPTATLTTTAANSWVFGVGNDFDNAIARTVGAGQTLVHQDLTSTGDTYWVQRQNASTPVAGTAVTINDTAPTTDRYNLAIAEVLPAPANGSFSISGNISPSSSGSGATVTLSGASNATTTADVNGNYSFTGLANGTYTVTPAKSGFSFTPPNQQVTISGANSAPVDFTAQPVGGTWTISGTISPAAAGSGATVTLSGAASAGTTADSSGNYSFTGLANGTYAVTPGKNGYAFVPPSAPVTINGASVSNVNFTGSSAPTSISLDANVSQDSTTASSTIASPSFSTTGSNEVVLAFVATDYKSGANTTVQSVAGGGLTWALVVRENGQSGTAEIWRAFTASPISNVTVTASLSQSVLASMTVMSFTGANGVNAIGATGSDSAIEGGASATLTTTGNNSWVLGVGNDLDSATARTLGSDQTLVHQDLTSSGGTFWVQILTKPVPQSGSVVSITDTAPVADQFNIAIVELVAGTGNPDTSPPTVSMASPAAGGTIASLSTVSAAASDAVSVASVQFFLDGKALGSAITSTPYSMTWDTTTASSGSHSLTAQATNAAGLTTTSSPVTVTVDNSGNPALVGSWSSAVSLPAVAVNLILLPNSEVLFYQDGGTATVWNYTTNTFTNVSTSVDLFCSGAALLSDGRVLVVGGYGGSGGPIGIANAEIFDPTTNKWTTVPDMAYRRWYPNATTLPDGNILVTAGWQTNSHTNAGISEFYNPATNTWTSLTNANNPFETYPFLYVLPDGRVIHIGGSEYATDTDVLDLTTNTWSVIDPNVVDGASATMYTPSHFMKAGTATDSQGVGPSFNTTYVLDMTQATPAWQQTPSMAYSRSFMNLTMLPDGTVLATGGETDRNGGTIANAVYAAELWSPATQTWSTMASMHTPREYHGTALLLPDGRVLESGMGADFGNVPNEESAEFYSPPYLFKGTRPTITSAPAQISYGQNFTVTTPDAASITSVVLIRTGAVTHFFDQNERFIPVGFTQTSGGLTVTAPANSNLAPPGNYMLFIVNSAGVPSVAPFMQIQ